MQETQETWVRSLGRKDSPGGANGNPLHYSCLENSLERGARWATVPGGVAKSRTQRSAHTDKVLPPGSWMTLPHHLLFFFFSSVLHMVKEPGISVSLFCKGINLVIRALPSGPNHIPKALSPNNITLKFNFEHMNLGETQIQSIAQTVVNLTTNKRELHEDPGSIVLEIHIEQDTAATAKSLQSCPTLCDPIDGSPPGSLVPGILQARTLEWVAISFSNA